MTPQEIEARALLTWIVTAKNAAEPIRIDDAAIDALEAEWQTVRAYWIENLWRQHTRRQASFTGSNSNG